jgi:hypothetical protein
MQFIPYGLFSAAKYLDVPDGGAMQYRHHNEARGGLDAKMVLRDALTLDVALNPDFSQVESDEPQALVNQRYEVYFPEKRPFLMDNASYFTSPQNLFFSRRIVDPQFGVRLTGKIGRWAIGALGADDRAPGKRVAEGDELHGRRAGLGVLRIQREFGKGSYVGLLATSRDLAASSNRVVSLDARVQLRPNWFLIGQAIATETKILHGPHQAGPGYSAGLSHSGRHTTYSSTYTDRSPGFRADLGYIPRVDIREFKNNASYFWRPRNGKVVRFGPGVTALGNWNRKGQTQDWSVIMAFQVGLPRLTTLEVDRAEVFELYRGQGFRKGASYVTLKTQWFRWLAIQSTYAQGTGVNYYPAAGLAPFTANDSHGSTSLTLRPTPKLRLDETYIMSRLRARQGPAAASIFNNHIVRSKVNYQFTRELSLRAIVDYNGVLPNPAMVSLDRSKTVRYDLLLTYMLHPGTALYLGYTDGYENWRFDPTQPLLRQRTGFPDTMTGRQVFVKLSYLVRY